MEERMTIESRIAALLSGAVTRVRVSAGEFCAAVRMALARRMRCYVRRLACGEWELSLVPGASSGDGEQRDCFLDEVIDS